MLTHLNETLNGISTIRVCKAEKILRKEFEKFEDLHTSACFCINSCRFSYALMIKLISHILLICVAFSFAIWKECKTLFSIRMFYSILLLDIIVKILVEVAWVWP